MGLAALTLCLPLAGEAARASECALVPYLSQDPDAVSPPLADTVLPSAGPALAPSNGRVRLRADNSLIPAFDSPCGLHLSTSFLEDQVSLDVAQAEDRPTFAALTAALLPDDGVFAWSLETSFMSAGDAGSSDSSNYIGARNGFSFFGNRLRLSSDFGLSMQGADETAGYATRYRLAADLWRSGDLRLSSTAGLALASPGYAASNAEVTPDRARQRVMTSLDWGRLGLDLEHAVSTDNTEGEADEKTSRWRVWSATFDVDLSGLHRLLPRDLSLTLKREHVGYADTAGSEDELDEISRNLTLSMGWEDRGGTTSLRLAGYRLDDATTESTAEDSTLEIGVSRAFRIAEWSLSAAATWVTEEEIEAGDEQRTHSLDLALQVATAQFWHGSLGLEGGSSFSSEGEGNQGLLEEATVQLTYDLKF